MTILSTTILTNLLTSSAAMWITAGILFVALTTLNSFNNIVQIAKNIIVGRS